jgi:hypothetical protein
VIARGGTLRHRTFRRGYDQRAIAPIENVEIAALRRSDQRGDFAARSIEIDETRLAADVHVPDIVVHALVHPAHAAGSDVERDDRAVEALAVGDAVAAPDVRRLVAHRQIDETQGFVRARNTPHVR